MWFRSAVLIDGSIAEDRPILKRTRFVIGRPPTEARPALLLNLQGYEFYGKVQAFHALLCYRLWLPPTPTGQGWGDMSLLASDVTPDEQALLKAWLIGLSWEAWARADVSVRAQAGEPDPPISLAEAARQSGRPYTSLVSEAERGTLPVINAADRKLVYAATLTEQAARGKRGRGRPRRGTNDG